MNRTLDVLCMQSMCLQPCREKLPLCKQSCVFGIISLRLDRLYTWSQWDSSCKLKKHSYSHIRLLLRQNKLSYPILNHSLSTRRCRLVIVYWEVEKAYRHALIRATVFHEELAQPSLPHALFSSPLSLIRGLDSRSPSIPFDVFHLSSEHQMNDAFAYPSPPPPFFSSRKV